MIKTVFITRSLLPKSVFKRKLTEAGYEVHGQSLIEFSPIPFVLPTKMDWLFFYSQKGVRYFFESNPLINLADLKIATIGPGTAEVVSSFGHQVHFVGDGNSKTSSGAFFDVAKNKVVVFPRAKNSRRSIQKELIGKIQAIDLVVYENTPRTHLELPECEVLVFTSPMNVQAYFAEKKKREAQRIIAIGATTAGALGELGIKTVEIAKEASEEALAEKVLLHDSKL